MGDQMQEVKPLMEPQRDPQHCGRRMRRFTNSSRLGTVQEVWVCDVCSTQSPITDIAGQRKKEAES